jgi:hypothetical protein
MGKEKGGVALLGRETRLADDEEFSQPKWSTGAKREREKERERAKGGAKESRGSYEMSIPIFILGGTQTTTLKDKNFSKKIAIKWLRQKNSTKS